MAHVSKCAVLASLEQAHAKQGVEYPHSHTELKPSYHNPEIILFGVCPLYGSLN